MQDLQIFQNTQFGNLEILTIEDKEWFPAIKVAELLGYTNPRDAVNRHTKQKGVANHDVLSNGGMQNKKFIDEGNLYRLITKSKLPQAEQFEEWVFEEVIPSIRKTGNYQIPQTPMQALEMMFSVQKEQQEFNNRIETEVTGIRNIVGMETKNWRNDTNKVLGAIAQHLGGGQKHKTVRMEAYKLLEEKGRCKLEQRLNNRKAKMLAKGATKTQINKLSKLDIINDEPRLIEIYISVIKSMAIKYGVDINQLEI